MTAQWISKEEAGNRLGVSPRRALELAKEGRLQSDQVVNPKSGKPVTRIQAGSVERFIAERGVIPDPAPRTRAHNEPMLAADPITDLSRRHDALPGQVEALARLLCGDGAIRTTSAPPPHLWLTVKEAAAYSGLPVDLIENCIGKGELKALFIGKGRRGGAWRIRKVDLEAFAG
jgi:excisionase family DNA binding protein